MKKVVNFVIAFAMVAIASSAFAQPKCNHQASISLTDNTAVVKIATSNNGAVVRSGTK